MFKKAHAIRLIFAIFLSIAVLGCQAHEPTDEPTESDLVESRELAEEGIRIIEYWSWSTEYVYMADQYFDNALVFNKNNALAIAGKGRVAMQKGYYSGERFNPRALQKALRYADEAIKLESENFEAHKLRGWVLASMGKTNEAFHEAEIIEKLDASQCKHFSLRARISSSVGDISGAIFEEKKALDCDLETEYRIDVYDRLGHYHQRLEDYKRAAYYHGKAVELNPASAWVYGNYAKALTMIGKLDKAEKMAKKALSIMDYEMARRHLSFIYITKGQKYLSAGEKGKAAKEFDKAIDANPYSLAPYLKLADMHLQMNNCPEAVSLAKKALEIDPKEEYAHTVIKYCGGG